MRKHWFGLESKWILSALVPVRATSRKGSEGGKTPFCLLLLLLLSKEARAERTSDREARKGVAGVLGFL